MAKKKVKKQPVDKKKQLLWISGAVVVVFLLIVGIAVLVTPKSDETDTTSDTEITDTADVETEETEQFDTDYVTTVENPTHYADIEIAGYGKITVALDANKAPETVANFVSLAESGFYDGLTFHRIIEGFMMQGGDPNGDGTGGSETTIKGEVRNNGVDNNLSHVRGAISMARSMDYDSGSSQFFIVHEDSLFLDGEYAAFGYVTEGLDVVDKVCTEAEPTDDNGTILPDLQPVITSITIRQ